MKINVSRGDFLSALSMGASLSGHNKAISVLDSVLVRVNERGVVLGSCDGDNYIKCRCGLLDYDADAEFTINGKDLFNSINSMDGDIVALGHDGSTLTVTSGKAMMSFPTGDASEYPDIQHGAENARASVSGDAVASLDKAIREASLFCERTDMLRPAMNCVSVDFTGDGISVYGTDGIILYAHDMARVDGMEYAPLSFLVHHNIIKAFSEVLSSGGAVTITDYEDKVSVRTDDAVLLMSKVQKKYPNVRAVIPVDSQPVHAVFAASALKSALRRAGVAANAMTPVVKFIIGRIGTCAVSSECVDYSKNMTEDMDAEVHADYDITVGFPLNKLMSAVSVLKGNVMFKASCHSKASLWQSDQDPCTKIVVMPLLIQ